ncbi:MAG: response regulator [Verrucomicrobia bacterium]|nr:response regulator [Verrucomicrobiota bacterium]
MDSSLRAENRPHKILLVEDEPMWRDILQTGLRDPHVSLEFAATAREALDHAEREAFDLVILDLGLPDLDGFELLRKLKLVLPTPHTPVLVLSAWKELSHKLRGFEFGIADYITKPIELGELRARVHGILKAKKRLDVLMDLNRRLEGAREEAEAVARAKADFLANMSHEIRTPMNRVIAMAEIVLQTSLTPEQRDCLETIRGSGETLLAILNDILNLSKIESGKLELERQPFQVQECVEEAVDVLAIQAAKKHLDLNCIVEEQRLPALKGDSLRLRQVITNLVGNAVKFTDKGEVSVEVKALRPDPSEKKWELHFLIRDTGPGIPEDKLGLLFQNFTQTDTTISRRFGGTGLGLAICKGLVELMGGLIWVESAVGKGSVFQFKLTLDEAEVALAPPKPAPEVLVGKRVLIVDDNETNRRILTLLANRWGMQPVTASRPSEALSMLHSSQPFHVAILDMLMPEMDGMKLAEEVRRIDARRLLPLILLTSIGPRDDLIAGAGRLFHGSLTKPVKPMQLEEALSRVCAPVPALLPRVPVSSLPSAPSMDVSLASRYPFKVLVVDDNLINLKVAVRLLAQMGYQAEIANNGEEAIAALTQKPYDLVFMDLQMPKLDGLEATRRIRARQCSEPKDAAFARNIVILAMTANAMPGDREKCLNAGMDDYIPKPVQPQKIQAMIELFGGHVFPTPAAPVAVSAPASGATPRASAAPAAPVAPPVNLERLIDFAAGDPQQLDELISIYVTQTTLNLETLRAALTGGQADESVRVSHSAAGASATCGMEAMAAPFKEIERLSGIGRLAEALRMFPTLEKEFDRTKNFLTEQRSKLAA